MPSLSLSDYLFHIHIPILDVARFIDLEKARMG